MAVKRVLLFGDPHGLPMALAALPTVQVLGLVAAAIRPHQHAEVRALARRHGVPFLIQPRPADADYPTFLAAIHGLAPDLILVNSYSMRLRAELLAIPRFGGVNVHGALLPEYRGASPLPNALLNMEAESGVTMHEMTPGFDEGAIIAQRRVPVFFEDTWVEVYDRIGRATRTMLQQEMPAVLARTAPRMPQDADRVAYYKRRHPEDGAIAWNASVLHLYNLIRALVAPYPGAFYDGPDARVVLDRYHTLSEVAALKFGPAGGQVLEGARWRLVPTAIAPPPPPRFRAVGLDWRTRAERQQANRQVTFTLEDRRTGARHGQARLAGLNFLHRTGRAELGLEGTTGDHLEAWQLLLAFATTELELGGVAAPVSGMAPALLRALTDTGLLVPSAMQGNLAVVRLASDPAEVCAFEPNRLT